MNAFTPDYGTPPIRLPPANMEMEASVLSILLNNATLEVVVGLLSVDDFSEEIHRRIFEVSKSLIAAGQTATPITLRTFLGEHDLGGITIPQYLARICGESANPLAAKAYAIGIHDLAIRRKVIAVAEKVLEQAYDLPVVDYLKQIQASDRYKGNRVYEVGEISYSLKQLAKDEGICVVLLAQLNRALEGRDDKRPSLSDLRESGDLEADADVVAFIHREAHYIEKSPEYRAGDAAATAAYIEARNKAEIIIGKNRAGPTRTVELWCDVSCSTMSDHVREERL